MKGHAHFEPKNCLQTVDVGEARLVGYRRIRQCPPCVILPVFVDALSSSNLLLYQRVDGHDRVLEFVGDPDLRLQHVIQPEGSGVILVRVGDYAIRAYETLNGNVICGENQQFRIGLKRLLDEQHFYELPFAGLEVARFLDDRISEITFAKRCAQSLVERSRKLATVWMEGADLSIDARRAAEALVQSSDPVTELDRYSNRRQRVADTLRMIKKTGRQEERIAILLSEILNDRDVGLDVLEAYEDRALFAGRVLKTLKSNLSAAPRSNSVGALDQIVIADLVVRMCRVAFPASRGLLLYHLSKYLAKYPTLNQTIRSRVNSSHSVYVEPYRNAIARNLAVLPKTASSD
jgi:hypothetical protein